MTLEAFFLGALQGLTEFLPISSSAHLILAGEFVTISPVLSNNTFDAILHGGSLTAIIVYFRHQLLDTIRSFRLTSMIFLSSLPALIAGYLASPIKDTYLRSPLLCAIALIVFGVYMIVADRLARQSRASKDLGITDYLMLGLAQAVALVPGTSRSGITISTGYMIGLKKGEAMSVSFLMAIPVTLAAFVYKLKDSFKPEEHVPIELIGIGLASTFFFSVLSLVILDRVIKRFKFSSFAYYRFVLAAFTLVMLWVG